MMSPNRKDALKASAASLQRRADRALQFWGVRSALLSDEIKMPPHPDFIQYVKPLAKGQRYATPNEIAVLRMKGNPAIRMNDLFRVTGREFTWLLTVAPSRITRWCRTLDYPKDMWWSDPDRPLDSRPSSIKENWNSARSLAIAGATDHETQEHHEGSDEAASEAGQANCEMQEAGADDSATEGIATRNQGEREDLAEEIELNRPTAVFGEDCWTDTEYPVLESQASFMKRGSNDDLDDLYGEEPKDPRAETDSTISRIQKGRGWRASRIEEAFQEGGIRTYHPAAHFMPSNACEELFGDQPAPELDEEGELKQGFFITRSEFFAQRDMMMEGIDSDYELSPAKLHGLKIGEIMAKGGTRDYRGWHLKASPGKLDLKKIRKADAKYKKALKCGQAS
jgi:hypothetical protein